jgi:hypothetical protein
VIDYFLDKGKAEGVKGNYLYTRQLDNQGIKSLMELSDDLQLGRARSAQQTHPEGEYRFGRVRSTQLRFASNKKII